MHLASLWTHLLCSGQQPVGHSTSSVGPSRMPAWRGCRCLHQRPRQGAEQGNLTCQVSMSELLVTEPAEARPCLSPCLPACLDMAGPRATLARRLACTCSWSVCADACDLARAARCWRCTGFMAMAASAALPADCGWYVDRSKD